jgi:hypothetical protein
VDKYNKYHMYYQCAASRDDALGVEEALGDIHFVLSICLFSANLGDMMMELAVLNTMAALFTHRPCLV